MEPRTYNKSTLSSVDIDQGLRTYMLRVYNYMAIGLLITGFVAFFAAASGIYLAIAQTPLIWVVMLAPLGMVFYLSARISRMSVSAAQLSFWIFRGLWGYLCRIYFLPIQAIVLHVYF